MGFLQELLNKLKDLGERIFDKIGPTADRLLGFLPEDKRKPVLLCAGATFFVLILVILVSLGTRPPKPVQAPELAYSQSFAIPGEELFVPEEPDFVPDFLPEREQRTAWTVEDVRPFWKEIGSSNRDLWQEEMSSIIDGIMETVP